MLKIRYLCLLVFALAAIELIYGQGMGYSKSAGSYKTQLTDLISKENRSRNNPDSVLAVIKTFSKLYSRFHDKTSMVYAEYSRAQYASLKSDFYKSMQLSVSSLNDAQKYNIKQLLPEIYALIGNLDKENTNYPMAFIAAQKGLDVAKENNDTSEVIQLLGLKAMFKRGYSLHFGTPVDKDSSLTLRLEGLKMAESNPKYERLRVFL